MKLTHAIDFLCEDMKVKVVLKFRGREMAHTEFGFQLMEKFLKEITPYGHPDSIAKLVGRAINVMISPLPRNKRAKNPHEKAAAPAEPPHKHSENHAANGAPHPAVLPQAEAGGARWREATRVLVFQLPIAHEFRKPALVTNRVRVVAKIPHYLQQALLCRRPFQRGCFRAAQ